MRGRGGGKECNKIKTESRPPSKQAPHCMEPREHTLQRVPQGYTHMLLGFLTTNLVTCVLNCQSAIVVTWSGLTVVLLWPLSSTQHCISTIDQYM